MRMSIDPLGFQCGSRFFEPLEIARRKNHPSAEASEFSCRRQTNSGTAPGNECELSGEKIRCKNGEVVQEFTLEQDKKTTG
jgi:hypothetical protein